MDAAVQRKAPKERIRGPNLAVLVKRAKGVPMEGALVKADAAGSVIASNKRLGKVIVGSEEWRGISEVFTCWSGTMAAYDKPDKRLGTTIEYTDPKTGIRYVFPVPEEHQGKKNIVLIAEHPDFTLETDGKTRIVKAKEVGVVPEFPVASKNWYRGHPGYDIPAGKKATSDDEAARYLWRIDKRVGLVAGDYCSRSVLLNVAPSEAFGVAVEAPDDHAARETVRDAGRSGAGAQEQYEPVSLRSAPEKTVVELAIGEERLEGLLANASASLETLKGTKGVEQSVLAPLVELADRLNEVFLKK
jgi:hypothetical protein